MKTFLILYCAFAYGFEFSNMLDFIFDENVHNRMKDEIRKMIRDIYFKNNFGLFVLGCRNKINFLNDLLYTINDYIDTYEVYSFENEPAEKVKISVFGKMYYDVCIKYESLLLSIKLRSIIIFSTALSLIPSKTR